MSFELMVNAAIWIAFLLWWWRMYWKHLNSKRAYRAIRKGRQFSEKYRLLKRIS